MNYEYCRVFYTVGKHKNITKAAAELYSSQPAVSRVISALERELGCKLFVRNKNGVEFTHEGQTLFAHVSAATRELSAAEDKLSQISATTEGTIYIGATITALHGIVFDLLNEFSEKFPKVKFNISTESSNNTVDKLKNGGVDVAFVTTPCKMAQQMTCIKMMRTHDVLIAGEKYSALKKQKISLKDTTLYPQVGLKKGMQLRQFIDEVYAKEGVDFAPEIEPDSANLIVEMVSHNFGIGIVPECIAAGALSRNEVFKVSLAHRLPTRNVVMVTNPSRPLSKSARELVRMANIFANVRRD